jgi:broad specificity phosphatase PhoE
MMAAMTRLVLVRHGETDWNREGRWQGHTDPGLNERGRAQARVTARRLMHERASALVTSDLPRAAETAALIAEAIGLVPAVDRRLREVDVGEWSGLTREQVRERNPDAYRAWVAGENEGYPGGETFAELQARSAAAMADLWRLHAEATVVVVCHGGSIRAIVAAALGIGAGGRRLLATGPNGSLSVLEERQGGGVGIASYNDSGHLPADLH